MYKTMFCKLIKKLNFFWKNVYWQLSRTLCNYLRESDFIQIEIEINSKKSNASCSCTLFFPYTMLLVRNMHKELTDGLFPYGSFDGPMFMRADP